MEGRGGRWRVGLSFLRRGALLATPTILHVGVGFFSLFLSFLPVLLSHFEFSFMINISLTNQCHMNIDNK